MFFLSLWKYLKIVCFFAFESTPPVKSLCCFYKSVKGYGFEDDASVYVVVYQNSERKIYEIKIYICFTMSLKNNSPSIDRTYSQKHFNRHKQPIYGKVISACNVLIGLSIDTHLCDLCL